jgi:hypothetical protein
MKIRKTEWHQVASIYEAELDEDVLSEIYPDLSEDEIADMMTKISNDEIDIDQVIEDAGWDVEFDWDHIDDDWWTSRKGGYEVSYEVDLDDSDNSAEEL